MFVRASSDAWDGLRLDEVASERVPDATRTRWLGFLVRIAQDRNRGAHLLEAVGAHEARRLAAARGIEGAA